MVVGGLVGGWVGELGSGLVGIWVGTLVGELDGDIDELTHL